ncbi:hypothetical protein ILP97_44635 [Amycolatopsis sp. H6(2020)]|nr:hypothetical protein [Amycolatopsis sp. H6(2020)]
MNNDARLNLDLDQVDWDARDEHGVLLNVPSAIREECTGPNPNCRRAHAEGRGVHFIPPRVQAWGAHLVLPTYHFMSVEEVVYAFADARKDAVEATSFAHRDDLYVRGLPAWVPFGLDR